MKISGYKVLFCSILPIAVFSGCAGSGKQIIVPTFVAPKEVAKVKGLIADSGDTKGKFLSFAINPKVSVPNGVKNVTDATKKTIISITKEAITNSNYILIHPVFNASTIGLSMSVMNFTYDKDCSGDMCDVTSELSMGFEINRGSVDYFAKVYDSTSQRSAEKYNQQSLPTAQKLSTEMIRDCVEKFIFDISPNKTNQLRELKSLPSEIAYVVDMAPKGNYENLVETMESYKGDKSVGYYYDLAVFYEALAATNEDLPMLKKAKLNYEKAMKKGGSSDALVVNTKARFDNFYAILDKLLTQQDKNKKQEKAIDGEFSTID